MINQTTEDLIRVAATGGGFKMDGGSRPTNDLIRIAAAAAGKGKIVFANMSGNTVEDLIRIASAGRGSAFFED